MSTVLLTGGNGLVGRQLCKQLQKKGFDVAILSRKKNSQSAIPTYVWNPEKMEIDQKAIDSADYIIHLAGENIGDKRWTVKRKQQIVDSRVKTCDLLFEKCKKQNKMLRAFIIASAVGYYGMFTSNHILKETDPPIDDFLSDTCHKWEQSANRFKEIGIRTVTIRTAVVLTRSGGALSRMLTFAKIGLGSAIGSGRQNLPWIHIDDLCAIYIKAIEDDQMDGCYNAVAPDHKTNKEFNRTIAQVLNKPFWLPNIPSFIMKCIFGDMSGMLLKGSRISSDKIIKTGFEFRFPELKKALADLILLKTN